LDRALDGDEGTKALGLATLDVLARSELARKEELELFDIAWKNVSGDDNGEGNGDAVEADGGEPYAANEPDAAKEPDGAMTAGGPPADAVDSGGFMGENGTTQQDEAKEVGP
jgi:hypothetical protein